jgi:hypothetical protein
MANDKQKERVREIKRKKNFDEDERKKKFFTDSITDQ